MLHVERKRVSLRKPTCHRGLQRFNQFFSHIQERQAWWAKKVLQRSGHVEVKVCGPHVHWSSSAVLIIVQHNERTISMRHADDFANRGTESVHEAKAGNWHNQGLGIYRAFVVFDGNTVVDGADKINLRSALLLGQPYMAHSGEFEFAQNHFLPGVKCHGAGDRVYSRRHIGHDCDFMRRCTDELGALRPWGFIPVNPNLPRRTIFMPARDEFANAVLNSIRQRSLRAAVKVDLIAKNWESRTDPTNFRIAEHLSTSTQILGISFGPRQEEHAPGSKRKTVCPPPIPDRNLSS